LIGREMEGATRPASGEPPRSGAASKAEFDALAFTRGVGLCLLIAASVAYAVALLGVKDLEAFIGQNKLGKLHRLRVVAASGGSAALVVTAVATHAWRRRLELLGPARIAMPLALVGPFVALFFSSGLQPLGRVAAMALAVLATERAVYGALEEVARAETGRLVRLRTSVARALGLVSTAKVGPVLGVSAAAFAGSLAYVTYVSFFVLRRHFHFQTMSNDLGQYDNFFFNALHGRPFQSNPLFVGGAWSALRSHAEFSMYALLPFYALYPHAETLLLLQTVLLGSAGIPVYLFGKKHVSPLGGLVLSLAFLFFAPLHAANFYDVHFQPIGAALVLWALYLLDAGHSRAGVAAVALAVLSREDVPLVFVVVGAFLVLRGRNWRGACALAGFAAAYFVVMKFGVMPRIGEWRYQFIYKELFPPREETYGGVIKTMLSNPLFTFGTLLNDQKLIYALQILVPLAFLPVRGRWLWLSLVPGGFVTLLTTAYAPTVDIAFQYSAYLIALIFPAAALALEELGARSLHRMQAALAALVAGTVLTTTAWGAFPPRDGFKAGFVDVNFGPVTKAERRKEEDLRYLASLIPESASVAVSENELPHVSTREKCYDLKDATFDADFLLYDKHAGGMGANLAQAALAKGEYERSAERGVIVLLRRKSSQQKLLRAPTQG
jgi:uncharacterized membrane protein